MGSWLAGSSSSTNPTPPASSLRLQSSIYGKVIPIGWGRTRIAGNLIWYGDFASTSVSSSAGGKGSSSSGVGGKGGTANSGTYNYYVSMALALCEGDNPVSIVNIWSGKAKIAYSTSILSGLIHQWGSWLGGALGFNLFSGTFSQTAWGYLTSLHPTQALNYRGIAYLASGPMALGNTPELPNITAEVQFNTPPAYVGTNDASPSVILPDFLSNVDYGLGFPSSRLADLTVYNAYCVASTLVLSPCLVEQKAASDHLKDWAIATNSEYVWSSGTLKIVPYGDQQITAGATTPISEAYLVTDPGTGGPPVKVVNHAQGQFITLTSIAYQSSGIMLTPFPNPGVFSHLSPTIGTYVQSQPGGYSNQSGQFTFSPADIGQTVVISYTYASVASYTPPPAPLYDLDDNSFILNAGSQNGAPVLCNTMRIEDQQNDIKVEFLDATNDYNPTVAQAKNDAAIQQWGLNSANSLTLHGFTQAASAQMCAQLQLGRQAILNTYEFTLDASYILLDPMDIVTLTDSGLGLFRQWVRITEITENQDFTLTFLAEEYLAGTAAAPIYGQEETAGNLPNYNASPGDVLDPLFFEPTDQLSGGSLEVWGAVTGTDLDNWGGCEVWVSYDGNTYAKIGDILGPSRMGVTTADLPPIAQNNQAATIDTVNTLSVDLTKSQGSLSSATGADLAAFATLMYVGGEYIAYQTATPTGTYDLDLTILNRGGYGTGTGLILAGSPMCRIDPQGIFKFPFTQDRIGQTVYFKFLNFNMYGGGRFSLSDAGAHAYLIQGTALISPLPDVVNFVSSFVGNITYLDWDNIDDTRQPILYEIRKGLNWDSGQIVGQYAHPHVPAFGDATYWIKGVCQPIPGLTIYSDQATELGINGSVIPGNILARYDEGPTGSSWTGTLAGNVEIDGPFISTTTSSSSTDVLLVADILVIADIFSIGEQGGTYTIPVGHIVSAGRTCPLLVQIIWTASASASNADFFAPADFFAQSDVFGAAANALIVVYPEIQLSTDGVTFGDWQKYQAGFYNAWKVNARMIIESPDPSIAAVLTAFIFEVYATDRIDHPIVNGAVGAGGRAVVFAPDNGAPVAAFNGGPNGGTTSPSPGVLLPAASLPGTQVTIINPVAGDIVAVNSLSLSGATVLVTNGGIGVSRNVTFQVWGF